MSREKDLSPDGHSGQPKLHAVVGSIEMLIGDPIMTVFFVNFAT